MLQNHANQRGRKPLKLPLMNPKILVLKRRRLLVLYADGVVMRRYPISLGFQPIGTKVCEGDGATPEGTYYIFTKNPRSRFYLSLGVSYPNQSDAERGLKEKRITTVEYQQIIRANQRRVAPPQKTALGGEIYLHGGGTHRDWTWGCVALDNADIKELFDSVPNGTPVIIEA